MKTAIRYVIASVWLFHGLYGKRFVYGVKLWKGNEFNTRFRFAFSAMWLHVSAVYGALLWEQLRSQT